MKLGSILVAHLRQEHGDAVPGRGVARIVNEPKERNEIADVGLFEKSDTTRNLIGDLETGKLELDVEGLKVRAIKDADVRKRAPFVHQATNPLHDELRLFAAIH